MLARSPALTALSLLLVGSFVYGCSGDDGSVSLTHSTTGGNPPADAGPDAPDPGSDAGADEPVSSAT